MKLYYRAATPKAPGLRRRGVKKIPSFGEKRNPLSERSEFRIPSPKDRIFSLEAVSRHLFFGSFLLCAQKK